MTDSLRDRIAAAMYEQRRTVSRVPMLSDWAGAHPTVREMWLSTADAVIAALPDYLWRCPKCGKGYWADHGPVCTTRDACFGHYPSACPQGCANAGKHDGSIGELCECRECR